MVSSLLVKTLNGVGVLDYLDGILLLGALGYKLELGIVEQVLEGLARSPADIDLLDVVSSKIVGCYCSLSLEARLEVAKVAKFNTMTFEHQFPKATYCHSQDTNDVTLAIDAAVVGDVLGELVYVNNFAALSHAISLGLGNVRLECSGLCAHDCNTVINHFNVRTLSLTLSLYGEGTASQGLGQFG